MSIFLKEFLYFAENYIQKNYPRTIINIIDIDKVNDFKYEENESPLHNNVIYLNGKLLNDLHTAAIYRLCFTIQGICFTI